MQFKCEVWSGKLKSGILLGVPIKLSCFYRLFGTKVRGRCPKVSRGNEKLLMFREVRAVGKWGKSDDSVIWDHREDIRINI